MSNIYLHIERKSFATGKRVDKDDELLKLLNSICGVCEAIYTEASTPVSRNIVI